MLRRLLRPRDAAPSFAMGAGYDNVDLDAATRAAFRWRPCRTPVSRRLRYTRLRSLAGPATATLTSLAGVARFLAHHYKMNVAAVDVGASATMLAGATTSGEFLPALFPQGGVGPGAGYVLRAVGAPSILRWLTVEADENIVREYVLTRILRRRMIPTTQLELELEYAMAREAIRNNQAINGTPRHSNLPIPARASRKTSAVRSSAWWRSPTRRIT